MRNVIYILLIIAFFSSGVSPACAFISGDNGFIDICSADGSITKIKVPDEFNPYNKSDSKTPKHKAKKNNCSFCFNSANLGKYLENHISIISPNTESHNIVNIEYCSYTLYKYRIFEPRSPPASFA